MRKFFLVLIVVLFSMVLINCGGGKLTNDSAKDIFVEKVEKIVDDALKSAEDVTDKDKEEANKKLKELKETIKVTDAKEAEDGKTGSAKFEMTANDYTVKLTFNFAKVDGDWKIKEVEMQGMKLPAEKFFDGMKSGIGAVGIKGKIKTTMADMRSLGMGLESYLTDNMFAPQVSSVEELKDVISPFWIKTVPQTDAWGNKLHYKAGELGPDQEAYFIGSGGSDGEFAGFDQQGGYTDLKGKDVIYSNGEFVFGPNLK